MSGAGIILFLNMSIAGLLCGFFFAIALYDRSNLAARWFTAAYGFGIVYVGGEAAIPLMDDARGVYLVSAAGFLAALTLLNIGIGRLYGVATRPTFMAGLVAVSLVLIAWTTTIPRDSMIRMYAYQLPFCAMQAVGAVMVFSVRGKRRIDMVLAAFLALSALHYLIKPFVAAMVGGVGARSQDYLFTVYAVLSQSMGTMFVISMALLLMAMMVGDLLSDARRRSETDMLSGLLNRRGFQERLALMLAEHAKTGRPLSLVVCDLDRFKRINDRFGHAAGDDVIVAFAQTLSAPLPGGAVAARIGGEEYAIALPRTGLPAARLYAESVRSVFETLRPLANFPEATFSASFGVTGLIANDSMDSLLSRADKALYAAKHDGRNRVRLAAPQPEAAPRATASG